MSDARRVSAVASDLLLSLEALSTVGKPKQLERPLSEALAEWRDKPLAASPELQAILKPSKDESDV